MLMPFPALILLILCHFIAGYGILTLFSIRQKTAITIALSLILGIAVASFIPFLLQLCYLPLTPGSVFFSLAVASLLLGIPAALRIKKEGFPAIRIRSFRIHAYEIPFLLILGFLRIAETSPPNPVYIPKFTNWRDNQFNGGWSTPDDTDADRVRLVTQTARARNPNIKILVSLGWYAELVQAASTPQAFATELASIVRTYGLDGFDIDYEETDPPPEKMTFGPAEFIALMKAVTQELAKVTPMHRPILTICPAMTGHLNKDVLSCFTYTMPQSYGHGGNGTTVAAYEDILKSYKTIIYGVNGEGVLDDHSPSNRPDDPTTSVQGMKKNGAAGVFSWRLDTDSIPTWHLPEGDAQLPTFAVANKIWEMLR